MNNYFDQLAGAWDQDPMKIERARTTANQCKRLSLPANQSLLDFGGGTGSLSLFLRDHFDSITIADTSEEMLKVARDKIKEAGIENITTFKLSAGISDIPHRYSAIITLMTLHHIVDIDGFLRGAANILNDRGTLIIADLYQDDGSFHKNMENYDGHNGFDIKQLSSRLESVGFQVRQVSEYFSITKEVDPGKEQTFPLFFLVAEKKRLMK